MRLSLIMMAGIAGVGMAQPAQAQRYPEIRDMRDGGVEIRMSGNCRLEFDRRGYRDHASRRCTGREIENAEFVLHGYTHPNRPNNWRPTPERPPASNGYDIIGRDKNFAESILRRRGFILARERDANGGGHNNLWYNRQSRQCLAVFSRSGTVRSVDTLPRQRCSR